MSTGHTIAVAGGSGFIGREVVAQLQAAGHRVIVLARGLKPVMAAEIELRACDLAKPVDAALLEGCELLVNLVGLKREQASMSFERAHVGLPVELAGLAQRLGMRQFIHVSVAGADQPWARAPGASPYIETKARGEHELAAAAETLALTILRPGVVHGPGDDMLRNLADSIRAAPFVPAPAGGRAEIAALAVEDLALAVVRCVERPPAAGVQRAYDIVGPERLTLREIVARVAASPTLARRCWVVPAPAFAQRAVAALLERVSSDPLITRAQLGLLTRGVVGDPEPARRELGLETRSLDEASIEAALAQFRPRLPSVRLVPDAHAEAQLRAVSGQAPSGLTAGFALLAVAAMLLGPLIPSSIWLRMAGLELLLSLLALSLLKARWAALWRPSLPALAWGLGAGALMWAGAFVVQAGLARAAPDLWADASGIYAWANALPVGQALVLLTVIVAGEEQVWRGALGVGLAGRMNPWLAVLASSLLFTLAHLTTGPPLLAIAAALAGGAWTYLAIRSRSLFASFVSHLAWDVTMLWLTPLI